MDTAYCRNHTIFNENLSNWNDGINFITSADMNEGKEMMLTTWFYFNFHSAQKSQLLPNGLLLDKTWWTFQKWKLFPWEQDVHHVWPVKNCIEA